MTELGQIIERAAESTLKTDLHWVPLVDTRCQLAIKAACRRAVREALELAAEDIEHRAGIMTDDDAAQWCRTLAATLEDK
jgi:hypothetical protein